MRCLLLAAALSAGACTTTDHGRFTVLRSSQPGTLRTAGDLGARASGADTSRLYLVIPDSLPARLDDALDQALSASDASTTLVDAKIQFAWWAIPGLFSQDQWTVTGTSAR